MNQDLAAVSFADMNPLCYPSFKIKINPIAIMAERSSKGSQKGQSPDKAQHRQSIESLTQDTSHVLFSFLSFEELLTMRKVNKSLQSLVDVELYRRYKKLFPDRPPPTIGLCIIELRRHHILGPIHDWLRRAETSRDVAYDLLSDRFLPLLRSYIVTDPFWYQRISLYQDGMLHGSPAQLTYMRAADAASIAQWIVQLIEELSHQNPQARLEIAGVLSEELQRARIWWADAPQLTVPEILAFFPATAAHRRLNPLPWNV